MPSAAYNNWWDNGLPTVRALYNVVKEVRRSSVSRRRDEIVLQAMVITLVGVFGAYARELFSETIQRLTHPPQRIEPAWQGGYLSPVVGIRSAVPKEAEDLIAGLSEDASKRIAMNPWPRKMNDLFKTVGMRDSATLWSVASSSSDDRENLEALVGLRNDLAHGETRPVTTGDLRTHIRLVNRLTKAIDQAVGDWLATRLPDRPWPPSYPSLGDPLTG